MPKSITGNWDGRCCIPTRQHPKWQFALWFNINRCLACQTCSMADKSTWLFSKGQEYVVEQRGNQAVRRVSQFYDVKITQLIEQVNPGGQVWNVGRPQAPRAAMGCSKE